MNLTELGLNKTTLVRLAFILIVILGIYSYETLPKYMDPDLNFNQAFITTIHKNLAAEDVEKFITTPIEDQIRHLPGIKKCFSTSSSNLSSVIIEFDDDIRDMNPVIQDLRNEVDKIDSFPEDTERPIIDDLDTAFFPICLVAVGGKLTTDQLFQTGEQLAEELEDIAGISEVSIRGFREREIYINVDPRKMESYGITLSEVATEVNRRNQNTKAGHIDMDEQKINIRLMGKYTEAQDFENLIFLNKASGGVILLRDFASVETGHEDAISLTKLNGKPAVLLQVKRKKQINVMETVQIIKAQLEETKRKSSQPLELTLFNDTSLEIKQRISVLQKNAILGMIMVFASLSFFLGKRQALFAFVGIPICFFLSFIFMKIFELSIDGVSLFALIIVLGMIVDDAIIVLENIHRHLEKGMDKREAIIQGTREVKWPITSAVLTSMAAFAPLFIVTGIMGKFLGIIPKVIIFALSASLFEVLFMMPSHLLEFAKVSPRKLSDDGSKEQEFHRKIKILDKVKKKYLKLLKFCLRRRYKVFFVFVVFLGLSFAAVPRIGVVLFPAHDAFPRYDIKIWFPSGTRIDKTLEKLETINSLLKKRLGEDVDSLISVAGFAEVEYKLIRLEHVGTINVLLKREKERSRSIVELTNITREILKGIDGIEEFRVDRLKEGPPTGPPVEFRIRGKSWDTLEEVSNLFQEELKKTPGAMDIRSDYRKNMKEIQVTLKQIEAKRYGITQKELSQTLRTAFHGLKATVYHEEDEEIDVFVRLAEGYRKDFSSILDLSITAADGRLVPLKEVAAIEIKPTLIHLKHFDRKRAITITSEIQHETTTSIRVNEHLEKFVEEKIRPRFPEVSLKFGGEYDETQKSIREVAMSFGLALFLIFIILATQFNSFIQPLIVMLAIPFGTVGVVVGLIVSGSYFTFAAMIGIVGLAGVIVNDSIVLISFVNDLRKKGGTRKPFYPMMKASLVRFRPIILTSVTTILGMLPMALGLGGKSPLWSPLANAFVWGISFSTTLLLILVPCAYLMVEDGKRWLGGGEMSNK